MRKMAVLIFGFAYAVLASDCRIFAPNKVICKNEEYGVTSIYRNKGERTWILKMHVKEKRGEQPEAVLVQEYFNVSLYSACTNTFYEYVQEKSLDISTTQIVSSCMSEEIAMIKDLVTGKSGKISFFEKAFDESKDISVMYCVTPTHVRTFKINEITGLETDRRDYYDLKPGTYCKDFLVTDDLYWQKR